MEFKLSILRKKDYRGDAVKNGYKLKVYDTLQEVLPDLKNTVHSPKTFRGGVRSINNCTETHGVIIDFDNSNPSVSDFLKHKFFKKYNYILYTSRSHNKEKFTGSGVNKGIKERFHVYFPFDVTLEQYKEIKKPLRAFFIKQGWEDDATAYDLARIIFPSFRAGETVSDNFYSHVNDTGLNLDPLNLPIDDAEIKTLLKDYRLTKNKVKIKEKKESEPVNDYTEAIEEIGRAVAKTFLETGEFDYDDWDDWVKLAFASRDFFGGDTEEFYHFNFIVYLELKGKEDTSISRETSDAWLDERKAETAHTVDMKWLVTILEQAKHRLQKHKVLSKEIIKERVKAASLKVTSKNIIKVIYDIEKNLEEVVKTQILLQWKREGNVSETVDLSELKAKIQNRDFFLQLIREKGTKKISAFTVLKVAEKVTANLFEINPSLYTNSVIDAVFISKMADILAVSEGDPRVYPCFGDYDNDWKYMWKERDFIIEKNVILTRVKRYAIKEKDPGEVKRKGAIIQEMLRTVLGGDKELISTFLYLYALIVYQHRTKDRPILHYFGGRNMGKSFFTEKLFKAVWEQSPLTEYRDEVFNKYAKGKIILLPERATASDARGKQLKALNELKAVTGAGVVQIREMNTDSYESPSAGIPVIFSNTIQSMLYKDSLAEVNQFFVLEFNNAPGQKYEKIIASEGGLEEVVGCWVKTFLEPYKNVLLKRYKDILTDNPRYGVEIPVTEALRACFRSSVSFHLEENIEYLIDEVFGSTEEDVSFFTKNLIIPVSSLLLTRPEKIALKRRLVNAGIVEKETVTRYNGRKIRGLKLKRERFANFMQEHLSYSDFSEFRMYLEEK